MDIKNITVVLIALLVSLLEATMIKPDVDWIAVEKHLKRLQSAIDRKDAEEIAGPAKAILDMAPSGTTNYMVGVSYGERSGVSYEVTGHLTGTHGTIGNPLINYDADCVYVSKVFTGASLFLTEDGRDIKSCKYDWWDLKKYTMFPIGSRPMVSYADTIKTVVEPYSTGANAFVVHAEFMKEWSQFPVAVNIRDVNFDTSEPGKVMPIYFGKIKNYCVNGACYERYRMYAKVEMRLKDKKVMSVTGDLSKCEGCTNMTEIFNSVKEGGFFTSA